MRWRMGRRSSNIEDRRGRGAPRRAVGGGIGIIIILIIGMFLGVDPGQLLNQVSNVDTASLPDTSNNQAGLNDELAEFVSVVLADTEDTWSVLFRNSNGSYSEPTLVMFTGAVDSACGYAQAAMGPFYCPRDQKLYIDLSFYSDLKNKLGAPGDFAQAYVIAHEVGHHVQNLIGISDEVYKMRSGMSESEGNKLSVMQELQADCFAGIWAYHANKARQIIEEGDIEEALNAATSIGDDRLQKQSRGYVTPDSFTHGSSAQRVRWFKRGITSGDIYKCNTFESDNL